MTGKYILQAENIYKSFPGVKALDGVSLRIEKGKVHALMGENGAGKSTLMKILIGMMAPDRGDLFYKGEKIRFNRVHDALSAGLSMIHQELLPFPELTVAENIYMGNEPTMTFPGWINTKKMNADAESLLEKLGIKIAAGRKMKTLSISEMQMVEIAKALSNNAEVIIMDEPTSAISDREVSKLFTIIKDLQRQGLAIIYISHKMEEILQIADVITVMRDGKHIDTRDSRDFNDHQLISLIVGRDLNDIFDKRQVVPGNVFLQTEKLTGRGFKDISFQVRAGEILGIAGLMGSGRTEIVNSIFGLEKCASGELYVKGKKVTVSSPREAIRNGIGLVSEDRKKFGLALQSSVRNNMTLSVLHRLAKGIFLNIKKENAIADGEIKKLQIKTPSRNQEVNLLSGGNQQKIIIARSLLQESDIIILDEPTRGIDIGAKVEIYRLMTQLADSGKAIIMISSELPEILGMSDRILVINSGRIMAQLNRADATQEIIMKYAMSS